MLLCNSDKTNSEVKTVFAILPIKTNKGLVWLEQVLVEEVWDESLNQWCDLSGYSGSDGDYKRKYYRLDK